MTTDSNNHSTILLPVDFTQIGRRESVPAMSLGENRYRLLASPGLAGGFAEGDEVEQTSNGYRLIQRSGNVCVQISFEFIINEEGVRSVSQLVANAGGFLDGGRDGNPGSLLVVNFPITVGFPTMEMTVRRIAAIYPIETWMYGNIHDADGVTLLNWWLGDEK